MGTRADFYVGRGVQAEWLGSIAWNGHPDSIPGAVTGATTEEEYRSAVSAFLASRDDATLPEQGWPWPWANSRTTDYAYAFDGSAVWASCFGHAWFKAEEEEPEDESGSCAKVAEFPDMRGRRKTAEPGSQRSGVMVFGVKAPAPR